VLGDDIELPDGSAGYVLDPRGANQRNDRIERLSAADLVSDLTR